MLSFISFHSIATRYETNNWLYKDKWYISLSDGDEYLIECLKIIQGHPEEDLAWFGRLSGYSNCLKNPTQSLLKISTKG